MKLRLRQSLLLLCSLFCYLEWGDQHQFLFQMEAGLFAKACTDWQNVLHPLILIPLAGQLLLLLAIVKGYGAKPTIAGICCIGILVLMVLLSGILSGNWKIIASALPFVVVVVWTVRYLRGGRVRR